MSDALSFLDDLIDSSQPEPELPGVGVQFASNFVGPWRAKLRFVVVGEEKPDVYRSSDVPVEQFYQNRSGSYTYLYRTRDNGAQMAKEVGWKGPAQRWIFETTIEQIVNVPEDKKDRFTNPIRKEVSVSGYRSGKMHALHLIALPSFVYSFAKLAGVDVPDSPLDDVIQRVPRDGNIPDSLWFELIGNPDDASDEDSEQHWTRSLLGQWRRNLWAAMGEPDMLAFRPSSAKDFAVTSGSQLERALRLFYFDWEHDLYAEITDIPDPHPDAYESGSEYKRRTVPAITQIFPSEADARAAAAATSAESKDLPPNPWKSEGYPDQWPELVRDIKSGLNGATGPPPVVLPKIEQLFKEKGYDEASLKANANDVLAWLPYV